jgi:hypothetical protein
MTQKTKDFWGTMFITFMAAVCFVMAAGWLLG